MIAEKCLLFLAFLSFPTMVCIPSNVVCIPSAQFRMLRCVSCRRWVGR